MNFNTSNISVTAHIARHRYQRVVYFNTSNVSVTVEVYNWPKIDIDEFQYIKCFSYRGSASRIVSYAINFNTSNVSVTGTETSNKGIAWT